MQHNGKEIEIKYTDFPDNIHGFVRGFVLDDGKTYLICVDNRNAAITKRFTLGHELAHIYLNHEMPNLSAYNAELRKELRSIEHEANKAAWNYYRAYRDNRL